MAAFTSSVDIANRGMQHCGNKRIASLTEISKAASEVAFCYDKLREAELMANLWTFAVKRVALRALDTTTMLLAPSLWSAATTYYRGSIIADELGNYWISRIPDNTANDPLLAGDYWEPYFGPMTVSQWQTGLNYYAGELVYIAAGDGTYRVYLSFITGNSDEPDTSTAWNSATTYFKDQVVTFNSIAYQSTVDLNLGNEPDTHASQWTSTFTGGTGSLNWLEIGGAEFTAGVALTTLNIVYPQNSGPSSQTTTLNVFRLPNSFLRPAPQDPKKGTIPLGGPSGDTYDDWTYESGYLISAEVGPILLRFVADITAVRQMHSMFCEGLAARIGMEVCETITQSTAKLQTIAGVYKNWIGQARIIDAIEDGYVDAPDDDFISVRA